MKSAVEAKQTNKEQKMILLLFIFRYEDVSKVRNKNIIAMAMFPIWAYLGQYLIIH